MFKYNLLLFGVLLPISSLAQIVEGISYKDQPTTITLTMPQQDYQIKIPANENKCEEIKDYESVWITETMEILSHRDFRIEGYIKSAPEKNLRVPGIKVEILKEHYIYRYDMSSNYIDSMLVSLEGIEHIYNKSIPEIEETRYFAHIFDDLYVVLYYGRLFSWKMKFMMDKEIQTSAINEDSFRKIMERLREFRAIANK